MLSIFLVQPTYADTTTFISSDASWKATQKFTIGWESGSFDDTSWQFALAPSIGTCSLGRQKPAFTTPMWISPAHEFQTVYFRKKFEVSGTPKKATLTFAFDDDGEVYLNGNKIFIDSSGKTESQAITIDVVSTIISGTNTLALKVIDKKGGCQWAQVYAELIIETQPTSEATLFMQTDDRWKDTQYAGGQQDSLDCGTTVGQCGCAVSSLAMLLDSYGVIKSPLGEPTNPYTLNEYFMKNQSCTSEGCVSLGYVFGAVRWSAVHGYTKQAHDAYGSPKVQFFGHEVFNKAAILETLHTENRPIIGKDTRTSHWFLLSKAEGDDIEILDPIHGKTSLNTLYQGKVEPILNFQEVHSDFSAIEIYVKEGVDVSIWGPDGKKLEEGQILTERLAYPGSLNTDSIMHHTIPHPARGTYVVSTSDPAKVVVYASDQQASSIFKQLSSKETNIEYNPENSAQSIIHDVFPQAQACLSETAHLRFPIIFTLRKDKDYIYKGELIARELLQVVP